MPYDSSRRCGRLPPQSSALRRERARLSQANLSKSTKQLNRLQQVWALRGCRHARMNRRPKGQPLGTPCARVHPSTHACVQSHARVCLDACMCRWACNLCAQCSFATCVLRPAYPIANACMQHLMEMEDASTNNGFAAEEKAPAPTCAAARLALPAPRTAVPKCTQPHRITAARNVAAVVAVVAVPLLRLCRRGSFASSSTTSRRGTRARARARGCDERGCTATACGRTDPCLRWFA
jgi:hypothetical protein